MTDMGDPYMYQEEGYDPYLQDADILDRPDLFYDGRSLGIVKDYSCSPLPFFLFTVKRIVLFLSLFSILGENHMI